jgi:hypothetical protein
MPPVPMFARILPERTANVWPMRGEMSILDRQDEFHRMAVCLCAVSHAASLRREMPRNVLLFFTAGALSRSVAKARSHS